MFIPHTDADRSAMLHAVGISKLEDLFVDVPKKYRFPDLNFPEAQTEMEISAELQEMSLVNETVRDLFCFLGAGAYNHYTPAAVDAIIRRGEFLTAYTPYQPELSQGTLQAIFEYQSNVAALTGMEVCNASHYDGATAIAEAVNMAYANFRGRRNKIILSSAVHPQYRQTVRTYIEGSTIILDGDDPRSDLTSSPDALITLIDTDTALVAVQYPDFFGRVYDYTKSCRSSSLDGCSFCNFDQSDCSWIVKRPGINESGYRHWRRSAFGYSPIFRRSLPWFICHTQGICS